MLSESPLKYVLISYLATFFHLFQQDESDCLGRIHAGRSLASFKLEQLSESYDDCVMAMEHLPQKLTVHRVKVLERMVCCKPDSAKTILKRIRYVGLKGIYLHSYNLLCPAQN